MQIDLSSEQETESGSGGNEGFMSARAPPPLKTTRWHREGERRREKKGETEGEAEGESVFSTDARI